MRFGKASSYCVAAVLCTLSIFSAAALPGEVLARFPVPAAAPTGLAWDGENLWVADLAASQLLRVAPDTGKVLGRLDAPGKTPLGLAWDGTRLWVLDGGEKRIYAMDPTDGKTLRTLELESESPQALGWDGKFLWVGESRQGNLERIDISDGTTLASIPSPVSGSGKRSEEIGMAFDGTQMWVSDRMTDTIYQMDAASGAVLNLVPSPGPYPTGLAWDGKALWCSDYELRTLFQVATLCSGAYATSAHKKESLLYQEAWQNYGPGTIKTLDIFMAVPGDLPNQKILEPPAYEPTPNELLTDQWGQKVAHFRFEDVRSGQEVRATMTVEAELRRVRWVLDPEMAGALGDAPQDIKEAYLLDEPKLDIHSAAVKEAVREAVGAEQNAYWVARKICKYIQDHLRYELAGGWNTVPKILQRGTGSCSEYTFTMIAMCRAAGLPARYQGSVVIRGDDASRDDVFHRWAEVYLPNYGWIPVDPSGGDSPVPEEQAKYFGGLDNRFLITTVGGGNSTYLGWDYNSRAAWTADGPVKVWNLKAGDWSPREKKYEASQRGEAGGLSCKP